MLEGWVMAGSGSCSSSCEEVLVDRFGALGQVLSNLSGRRVAREYEQKCVVCDTHGVFGVSARYNTR